MKAWTNVGLLCRPTVVASFEETDPCTLRSSAKFSVVALLIVLGKHLFPKFLHSHHLSSLVLSRKSWLQVSFSVRGGKVVGEVYDKCRAG